MSYKIVEKSKDKVILSRKGIFVRVFFLILFGSLFVGVGLLIAILAPYQSDTSTANKIIFIFAGGGALTIIFALSLPQSLKRRIPEQVIFDNTKGIVRFIHNTKSIAQAEAFIRYDEIERLDVRQETHTHNSKGRSKTYYTYYASILKKDLGSFDFFDSTDSEKVQKFVQQIAKTVDLTQPSTVSIRPELPGSVQKDIRSAKVYIRWKNAFNFLSLVSLLFTAYIAYFLFSLISLIKNLPTIGFVIIGFIICVFLLITVVHIRNIIKDFTTIFGFCISRQDFEYFEEKKNGKVKTIQKIPLNQLHSVTFNLTISSTQDFIILYTQNAYKKQKKLKEKDFSVSNVKDAFSLQKEQISLKSKGLTTVEKIQLEYWIQEVIKDKSSIQVL